MTSRDKAHDEMRPKGQRPDGGNHRGANRELGTGSDEATNSTKKSPKRGDAKATSESDEKLRRVDVLIGQARELADFFHDEDGNAYATIRDGRKRSTVAVRSRRFRSWLAGLAFATTGRGIGTNVVEEVLSTLDAVAIHQGAAHEVYIRTALQDGVLWVDLGDDTGEAVRITPKGWEVTSDVAPKFKRVSSMRRLPRPTKGGTVASLRPFLNVADDHGFHLALAWIVASLRPGFPFPIAVFAGEQGTGKSTASRLLRAFVDPNKSPIRATPKDEESLFVAATNAHVLAYDNLSGVAPWLSDGLCRLATGGGFAKRGLYTDGEEHVLEAKRPIIINGIDDMTTRPDLAERALLIRLAAIPEEKRVEEGRFWKELEAKAPSIFGAILDGVSSAMARGETVQLAKKPRMADFAMWATAAEPGLRLAPGSVMRAFDVQHARAVEIAIESNQVAAALMRMLAKKAERPDWRGQWEGTASALLGDLNELVGEEKDLRTWPRAANILAREVNRMTTALREAGVRVESEHRKVGRWFVIARP